MGEDSDEHAFGRLHHAAEAERQTWERHRAELSALAQRGLTVKETLAYIRHPGRQAGFGYQTTGLHRPLMGRDCLADIGKRRART